MQSRYKCHSCGKQSDRRQLIQTQATDASFRAWILFKCPSCGRVMFKETLRQGVRG
jgi:uncharacterized Zn finger protein